MSLRRVIAATTIVNALLLAQTSEAIAQAKPAMEDHSRDAQLIAGALLFVITTMLLGAVRRRLVANKNTKWTDAAGTEHNVQKGWIVPPGTNVPESDVDEKRLSAFRSLYLGKDNRASTSKAVALAWTYAVAYGLLSVIAAKVLGSEQAWDKLIENGLQEEYLLLLGGPYAAALIAKYVAVSSAGGANKTTDPTSSPANDPKSLIADDEGDTDLGDFQYLLFNVIALAYFLSSFIPHLLDAFPELPSLLVGLALTSATTYAAKKAAISAAGPQLSSVFPTTVAKGNPVELWGRNLVSDTQKPLVSVGDVVAAVDVVATTGATDRLRVTLPPTVDAGEQQLKVTTPAGVQALTSGGSDHLTLTVT